MDVSPPSHHLEALSDGDAASRTTTSEMRASAAQADEYVQSRKAAHIQEVTCLSRHPSIARADMRPSAGAAARSAITNGSLRRTSAARPRIAAAIRQIGAMRAPSSCASIRHASAWTPMAAALQRRASTTARRTRETSPCSGIDRTGNRSARPATAARLPAPMADLAGDHGRLTGGRPFKAMAPPTVPSVSRAISRKWGFSCFPSF